MTSRPRWSERLKVSARNKLINAVQDAVAEPLAESDRRHRELIKRLDEQGAVLADLRASVDTLEFRMRHDMPFASDLEAVASSADFAETTLDNLPTFTHPHETLRFALDQVSIDGMALEFGVATGTTLTIIAEKWKEESNVGVVVGFDTFDGLPEPWRTGYPVGEFAVAEKPDVPGAFLVEGLFQQTLATFLSKNRGPVAFLHLDADLYSSTDFVLRRLESRLKPGTIIVFDEFFNFPGWEQHEYRAWVEFVKRAGVKFDYLAYTSNSEQVVVRITG
ncbi:hypothetical protein GCM10007304_49190 [Rhodococcoides trifolii]|uniref:Class I SAM-dependent methyltransferase n=1 Tax=Rhodococcoides trifolii TaxID=908250 RepID=A0A917LIR6_9NOCA|nr:class I SAM-dependent methyltransferase [Rhodococcus trifolii]GGG29513.1 hypothetical protein GCM10007304_49190 [Rhodococcus trifolii]